MESRCNKRECNKGESLFHLTMKESLEAEVPALWKTQRIIQLSYLEIPDNRCHWSIQLDIFSHVLFSVLTWEKTEAKLNTFILLWYQEDIMMALGEFVLWFLAAFKLVNLCGCGRYSWKACFCLYLLLQYLWRKQWVLGLVYRTWFWSLSSVFQSSVKNHS